MNEWQREISGEIQNLESAIQIQRNDIIDEISGRLEQANRKM